MQNGRVQTVDLSQMELDDVVRFVADSTRLSEMDQIALGNIRLFVMENVIFKGWEFLCDVDYIGQDNDGDEDADTDRSDTFENDGPPNYEIVSEINFFTLMKGARNMQGAITMNSVHLLLFKDLMDTNMYCHITLSAGYARRRITISPLTSRMNLSSWRQTL